MLTAMLLTLAPLVHPDPCAPWEVVEACPRLVAGGAKATAVVVGRQDGFAYLLTAYHAVDGQREIEVQFFNRWSYPELATTTREVEVVATFRSADFALLKVPDGDSPMRVLSLAKPTVRPLKLPLTALSVGCNRGEPPTGSEETMTAKRFGRRDGNEQAFFWETTTPPVPGRSGGPLVVGRKVVGLCVAGHDNHGYFAHADELLAGLKDKGYGWLWEEK